MAAHWLRTSWEHTLAARPPARPISLDVWFYACVSHSVFRYRPVLVVRFWERNEPLWPKAQTLRLQ
jgi:hypothetical protein